jgi:hypothetical protein
MEDHRLWTDKPIAVFAKGSNYMLSAPGRVRGEPFCIDSLEQEELENNSLFDPFI